MIRVVAFVAAIAVAAPVVAAPPPAASATPASVASASYTLIGAAPLPSGVSALRLSGGLIGFVPTRVAGLNPLAEAFFAVLPEGGIALGIGAGRADAFVSYATVGGLIHQLGVEGRFAFLRGNRSVLALAGRVDYQLRGIAVESFAFAGGLRFSPDLRAEVSAGPIAIVARGGFTVELINSDYIDGVWTHLARPWLSTYDIAAGVEWAWGTDARFFVLARAQIAADPGVQTDQAWIGLTAGGGFPL